MKQFVQRLGTIAFIALAMTGCGRKNTKPSCPVPDGVKCMSTHDVYERTHGSEFVGAPEVSNGWATGGRIESDLRIRVQDDALALVNDNTRSTSRDIADAAGAEAPVRTPARIMRVWVGPWQDADGGLHMPALVFKEVEPRRWRIGNDADADTNTLRLLDGLGVGAEQDAQTPANANAGSGHPSSNK